jgi:hypothetical protein
MYSIGGHATNKTQNIIFQSVTQSERATMEFSQKCIHEYLENLKRLNKCDSRNFAFVLWFFSSVSTITTTVLLLSVLTLSLSGSFGGSIYFVSSHAKRPFV